ncbi:MAG: D-tyrosyl-tRNA(Tyr) deacylase [Polyangiales bacterium]|jgi:D-tyrosyl-tRNA(Tyr) deacylase
MRAVVQRVSDASVHVDGELVGAIRAGLLVYIGVGPNDGKAELDYMSRKIAGLRIFQDDEGRMSRSVQDVGGSVLLVSQFTLYGDVRKGRRPSFMGAAGPEHANALYEALAKDLAETGLIVAKGRFRADMRVSSTNVGPVTLLLDSEKTF